MRHDVIVVGGGAIGLALARSFAPERSVLLIERDVPGRQASWAAAGMLCPHSEADADDPVLRFGLASLEMYREFAVELQRETGIDVEYRTDGVLLLAATEAEQDALERRAAWQEEAGLDARLLSPGEVARLEPEITLGIRGALHCPAEHQVRPRRLLEALQRSCGLRGVEILEQSAVDEVAIRGNAVSGVRIGTREIASGTVIVAAGAWTSQIQGLVPPVASRPRKGQALSLQMPGPVFKHLILSKNLYFVPRNDNRLVVGATNEDVGFDRGVTASGIGGLLRGAMELSSAVGGYPILETWSGLRPMLPDGLPAIGPTGVDGLHYAVGHYRNGILWTPGTVAAIGRSVAGEELPAFAEAFAPIRRAESVASGKV